MTQAFSPQDLLYITIGFLIKIILASCNFILSWVYYHKYKNDDSRLRKASVLGASGLSLAGLSIACCFVVKASLRDATDFQSLPWQIATNSMITASIVFIAQAYFALLAWKSSGRNIFVFIPFALVISFIWTLYISMGIMVLNMDPQAIRLGLIKNLVTVASCLRSAIDVFISTILFVSLSRKRFSNASKRKPVLRFAIYSLQLGILSGLWSLAGIILYLSCPSFAHTIFVLSVSEIYYLAMLTSLLIRSSVFSGNRLTEEDVPESSPPINRIPSPTATTLVNPRIQRKSGSSRPVTATSTSKMSLVTAPTSELHDVLASYISSEDFQDPDRDLSFQLYSSKSQTRSMFSSFSRLKSSERPQAPPEPNLEELAATASKHPPPNVHHRHQRQPSVEDFPAIARSNSLPEVKTKETPRFVLNSDGSETFSYGNYHFERREDEDRQRETTSDGRGSESSRSPETRRIGRGGIHSFEKRNSETPNSSFDESSSAKWLVAPFLLQEPSAVTARAQRPRVPHTQSQF